MVGDEGKKKGREGEKKLQKKTAGEGRERETDRQKKVNDWVREREDNKMGKRIVRYYIVDSSQQQYSTSHDVVLDTVILIKQCRTGCHHRVHWARGWFHAPTTWWSTPTALYHVYMFYTLYVFLLYSWIEYIILWAPLLQTMYVIPDRYYLYVYHVGWSAASAPGEFRDRQYYRIVTILSHHITLPCTRAPSVQSTTSANNNIVPKEIP